MSFFKKLLSGKSATGVGVQVKGQLIEFNCESIDLYQCQLCDDDIKEMLEGLIEGKFTRVKEIYLVSFDVCAVALVLHGWGRPRTICPTSQLSASPKR